MSRRTIALDGPGWTVREALGDTWRWYVGAPLPDAGNNVADAAAAVSVAPGWLAARVPGSVVGDLHRAGEIPDPRVARQSRAAEWTGDRSWVYRRAVEVPDTRPGDRVAVEIDGVDPGAEVFWDGEPVGRTGGLFHATRIDLTERAAAGTHRLALVVAPVPPSQPQVGRTELVRVHAPRMNYGWDFCPPSPHQGIWRPVRLVVAPVQVRDVQVRSELDADLATGRVHVSAVVEAPAAGAVVEAVLLDGDHELARTRTALAGTGPGSQPGSQPATHPGTHPGPHPGTLPGERPGAVSHPDAQVRLDLRLDRPRPWWPNRHGRQHLYRVRLEVDGEPVAQRDVGFRHVTMTPNPGAPPDALPYSALVNGVPVPLVGWNWVPADAQHGGVPADRVRHLVDLAARSGARVLRVWGGGLLETPDLYDACDRAGLLVWQEFSQSSSGMQSAPASDDEFVARMRDEARAVVPPRTHHPSLLMWGGGNELDLDGVPLDEDRSPVLAALRDEVHRLDPGRHWVPTSPSGPAFHNRLDVIARAPEEQHDVHGPWEHQGLEAHHTLYDAGTSLAHTEFGVEGMTNLRALAALVPADQRWPADRTNPVYRHLGEWWNNADLVQRSFGGRLTGVEQLQRASQLLQATGLAYAVEADRRRAPRCSMVLPWQLGESFPNAWCTSVVDHHGEPKPAYYAVTRAFADRRVTVRVETSVWAGRATARAEAWVWSVGGSGAGTPAGSRVTVTLRTADGAALATTSRVLDAVVTHPVLAGTLEVPLAGVPAGAVLVWDLAWHGADGAELDQETVLAAAGPDFSALLDLAPARIEVDASLLPDGDWLVEVAHAGGPVVVGLALLDARPVGAPGWAVVETDPRPLLPGGTRRSRVRWRGADGPRRMRLESWNTRPTVLDEETLR